MNEPELTQAAIGGSKESFIRLIRANEQTLFRTAIHILQSETDAADAIQETILKAYQGIRGLREAAFFRTWLMRILINECRQSLRKSSKLVLLPASDVPPAAGNAVPPDFLEDKWDMEQLLSDLDVEHREIIVLFYMEDLPIKDMAGMLQISEGTVKSRLHRARMKLAAMLNTPVKQKEELL